MGLQIGVNLSVVSTK